MACGRTNGPLSKHHRLRHDAEARQQTSLCIFTNQGREIIAMPRRIKEETFQKRDACRNVIASDPLLEIGNANDVTFDHWSNATFGHIERLDAEVRQKLSSQGAHS